MSKTATILCVRAEDAAAIPMGASKSSFRDLPDAWAGPRPVLEDDPRFLQIIPYVVVRLQGKYLTYVRTTAGGEARLHGRASIGLGGHVDFADVQLNDDGSINLMRTAKVGARRELLEEINTYPVLSNIRPLGWVRWDENPVDRVHLGIVMLFDMDADPLYERVSLAGLTDLAEEALGDLQLLDREELTSSALELETWTRLALDLL